VIGEAKLKAKLDDLPVPTRGLVSDCVPCNMLGSDWMSVNRVEWQVGTPIIGDVSPRPLRNRRPCLLRTVLCHITTVTKTISIA